MMTFGVSSSAVLVQLLQSLVGLELAIPPSKHPLQLCSSTSTLSARAVSENGRVIPVPLELVLNRLDQVSDMTKKPGSLPAATT